MTGVKAVKHRRKVGRPTLFKPEFLDQARRLALLGLTNDEMARFFEVGIATFNRWLAANNEFRYAVNESKTVSDSAVVESLFRRATGFTHPDVHITNFQGAITITPITKHYAPDPTSMIFWLKNRQPGKWRDKVEQEVSVSGSLDAATLDELFVSRMRAAHDRQMKILQDRGLKEMEQ